MSSMSGTKALGWTVAMTLIAGTALSGCSDIYYDRRETIALGADDAVASNRVIHMVDPWPPYSANRNIAFNGQRTQRAVECYRADKVTTPVDPTTSNVLVGAGASGTVASKCEGTMSSAVAQPSAVSQTNGQTGNTTTVINH
jgi:hypothetical protein